MPIVNDPNIRFACPQHVVDQVHQVAEIDAPPGGKPNLSAAYRSLLIAGIEARFPDGAPDASASHAALVSQGFTPAGPLLEGAIPIERPVLAGQMPEVCIEHEVADCGVCAEAEFDLIARIKAYDPEKDSLFALSVPGCVECDLLTIPNCPEHGAMYYEAHEAIQKASEDAQLLTALDEGNEKILEAVDEIHADQAERQPIAKDQAHDFQGEYVSDGSGLEACAVCKLDEPDHDEKMKSKALVDKYADSCPLHEDCVCE